MSETTDVLDAPVLQHVTAGFIESQNERIKDYEKKIQDLEDLHNKSLVKRLAGQASVMAVFLGVVISISQVYNAFVTEPATVRIEKISQFNDAVSAAAKINEDEQAFNLQNKDPQAQMQMRSVSSVQYLTDISTAEAYMKDLAPQDVGVAQLGVLFNGAMFDGDTVSAGKFVNLAVGKTDVTPYEHSEAERYLGEFLIATGDLQGAHAAYMQATGLARGPTQAYDFAEAANGEFGSGDCADAMADFQSLAQLLNMPRFPTEPKTEIMTANERSLLSMQGGACSVTDALALFGG